MLLEMKRQPEPEPLTNAWRQLRQVRQNLLNPSADALSACIPLLEAAAKSLRNVELALRTSPENRLEMRAELDRFRSELSVVNALLRHAGSFYLGWAQLLAASAGGYTSSGYAAPLKAAPRLQVRG